MGTFGTGFVLVPLLPTGVAVFASAARCSCSASRSALRAGRARRAPPPAGAGALVVGGATLAAGSPCDAESDLPLRAASLATRRGRRGRVLVLDDLRHSYVDLRDPRHLEFDYTRWIGDAIDAMAPPAAPLDAVFVGGGGFTLPRYLAATRPGSRSRVLEVDAALVELARERLGAAHRPGAARPHRRRARDAARRAGRVGGRRRRRRLRRPRRALAPRDRASSPPTSGACCARTASTRSTSSTSAPSRLLRAVAATLLEAFADVALVAPPRRPGGPARRESRLPRLGAAAARRGRAVGRAARARSAAPRVARFAGGAGPLRDDDAPADQLQRRDVKLQPRSSGSRLTPRTSVRRRATGSPTRTGSRARARRSPCCMLAHAWARSFGSTIDLAFAIAAFTPG